MMLKVKSLINIFCIILFFTVVPCCSSQKVEKDTIYLLFKKNEGDFSDALGKKFINKNGINFNLLHRTPLIHKNEYYRDTLCVEDLDNFKIIKEEEIDKKVKEWRIEYNKSQKEKLGNKYMEYYVPISNRNYMFQTYVIEKLSNGKIVLYEVKFRNEGVIP